jgi:uncharacterized repeat protein (TIGR01451 family)
MKRLLLLVFIGIGLSTWGQTTLPKVVNYFSRRIITSVVQDDNTMWIGTAYGGIYQCNLKGEILKYYNIENGLVDNYISCILRDKVGNIWFGSMNGLYKYDHTFLQKFSTLNGMPNNNVLCMTQDKLGNLWIGTDNGVSKFDGTLWSNYHVSGSKVFAIAVDSTNNIWAGTGWDISKYDGTTWKTISDWDANLTLSGNYRSIAVDNSNTVWIGSVAGYIFSCKNGKWNQYDSIGLSCGNTYTIYIDSNGDKLFGTPKGILRYNNSVWAMDSTGTNDTIKYVNAIAKDINGNLWFGTGRGLIKQENNKLFYYTDGIVDSRVNTVKIDKEKNLWIGTDYGISRFDGLNWKSFTMGNGLIHDCVYSIAFDKNGDKWFGTAGGISKFDGKTWTSYKTANGLNLTYIYSILIDNQGNVWASSNDGVHKFDGEKWKTYTISDGLVSNSVYSISVDNQDNIWAGTSYGISKFDGKTWKVYKNIPGGQKYVKATSIDANGEKWFGETNGFIVKTDGKNWNFALSYDDVPFLGTSQAIEFDNKANTWIATDNYGLLEYNGTSWKNYSTNVGFINNNIKSIAIDDNGNKWLATSQVLTLFNENGVDIDALQKGKNTKTRLIGQVFFDKDNNGIYTFNESLLKNQKILLLPDSIVTFSDKNGKFLFNVDSGKTYRIKIPSFFPFKQCTQQISDPIKVSKNDTIIKPIGLFGNDTIMFSSIMTNEGSRCGTVVPFYFTFRNTGTKTINPIVVLSIDNRTNVLKTNPPVDSIGSDGRYFWKYNNIPLQDDRQIKLNVRIPLRASTPLYFAGEVVYNDTVIVKNNINSTIRCSYDPNEKQVSPSGINKENLTFKKDELHYTIYFQNTGNDYAYNVKILDTLNRQFDISTFEVTASSHEVRTELSVNGIVSFYFDNIMLPDSGLNFTKSNGFVTYSIKPKTSVNQNTKVQNTAHIFFDQNPAIITNTTLNTLIDTLPCQATSNIINIEAKHSYIHNGQIFIRSGIYKQNLLTSNGCDSILTLNIHVIDSTTLNISSCNIFSLNGKDYTNSGIYIQKLVSSVGNDSIVTLNLRINKASDSTIVKSNINQCVINGQTYVQSGNYTQILKNINGCDSILHINLTISYFIKKIITSCSLYRLNDTVYTKSGIYQQNMKSIKGNDSIVVLNLIINEPTSSSISAVAFKSYTLNTQSFTSSNDYFQTLTNTVGCDSTISLHLLITNIAGDTNGNGKIDATEKNGDTNGDGIINNNEILGDTNGNGILDNGEVTGILEINGCSVSLYPVPVKDKLTIRLTEGCTPTSISIINSLGQTIYSVQKPNGQSLIVDMTNQASGSYVVQVIIDSKTFSTLVIKE